jgi:sorbitol-6-phosphate 2-dehydrogenase
MHWLNLEGKVAVVTGGAAGIGRAVCAELAACGAVVIIGDMQEESGKALELELQAEGGTALFVKLDVTSKASVDDAFAAVVAEFGQVDILVNNAGINIPRLLVDPAGKEEMTEAVWDKLMAVNMKGMFLCGQAAARVMLQQGAGVIINMASESGMEGSEGQSAYAATKAAGYNLTRSWAKELGRKGVRVAGVAPGILEVTGMRTEAYEQSLAYSRGITIEQLRASYAKSSIPLGRSGTLQEVANTVAFLASDRASYIHGTVVNVSGGKSRA